jgi:2-oxoglutarate/2-oxoacid ferredoxin oxidoreductase subunit beta
VTSVSGTSAADRVVFGRPALMTGKSTHYCPGCSHGIVNRLVAEVLEEFDLGSTTIGVSSVGCSILMYDYLEIDYIEALHGRAPAVATGIKRMRPDRVVFTYQGDGDLAAIGTAEFIHAAVRGENITTIFVNNAVYGMTGGQMAPTTLCGQPTTSTPLGRDPARAGHPVKVAEMIASQDGPAYVARTSVADPAGVARTRRAIKRAFQAQTESLGYSLVEVLAACPVNWGLAPPDAYKWISDHMVPFFPPGEFKVHQRLQMAHG